MQYAIDDVKSKTDFRIIGELPKKNIDTGMGMERVAFIKQGVENMYEIDQVRPVLDRAAEISGRRYGAVHEDDVRFRVIADHIRSGLMLMADGVVPGNEGGSYILRRLLRRSVRAMRLLGVEEPTFTELFAASRDAMKGAYPEVETEYARIERLAVAEEEAFLRTLVSGTTILDTAIARTKSAGAAQLPSDTAFQLHDTYGFPIDLTLEIAEEAGLTIDRAGFDALMDHQRQTAKADAKAKKRQLADHSVYSAFRAKGETAFLGYDQLIAESRVLGIVVDGRSVSTAKAGQTAEVVLAETSLYAESGGQDADAGVIVGPGYELDVIDVQKPVPGLISHTVLVRTGEVAVDDPATTIVDEVYRRGANRAHSATHLVHAALRQILGPEAHQAGSYNKAGYLRLDFSWTQALSPETRSEVEDVANRAIVDDLEVSTRILPIDEARAEGAMALFGEKYGSSVRVVRIGDTDWSLELCAGTHVARSSDVGLINLVGESSVGSTARRVEALVSSDALADLRATREIVSTLTSDLKTPRDQLVERIAALGAELKAAERRIAQFEAAALSERVPALIASAKTTGAVALVRRPDRCRRIGGRHPHPRDERPRTARLRARGRRTRRRRGRQAGRDRRDEPGGAGRRREGRRPREDRRRGARRRRRREGRARTGRRLGRLRDSRGARGDRPRAPGRMRPGVRLAVDVGTVRIGVARSDALGMLASPLETVPRGFGDLARIVELAAEHDALDVYVGRPAALSGRVTASTEDAIAFAAELAGLLPDRVRLVDERLTTVTAQGQLRSSGKDSRKGRAVIDQVAAAIMLEHALDSERQTGIRPGTAVPGAEDHG